MENKVHDKFYRDDQNAVRRIAYVVNHAAFFVSHRLALAEAARDAGYDVCIILGRPISLGMEEEARETLSRNGFRCVECMYSGKSINPLTELIGFIKLCVILLNYKPNIVHCISPKGILYGGMASRFIKVDKVLFAFSGLGYLFSQTGTISLIKDFFRFSYKKFLLFSLHHSNRIIIVQNNEDAAFVTNELHVDPKYITLIPGSGVDLNKYPLDNFDDKENIVLFASRMLAEKGVREFAAAARILKKRWPEWRFVMAGAADYTTPSSISVAELKLWDSQGHVEYLGYVSDMQALFSSSSICCLPSYYREGLPKTLIEAAAARCAVVTSNSVGCRDAVVAGVTGDLVEPRAVSDLVEVLSNLMASPARIRTYGRNGRLLAEEKWSIADIASIHLRLYGL